jgi:hypothetical protein
MSIHVSGANELGEKLTEVVYFVIVWLTVTCSVYVDTDV